MKPNNLIMEKIETILDTVNFERSSENKLNTKTNKENDEQRDVRGCFAILSLTTLFRLD